MTSTTTAKATKTEAAALEMIDGQPGRAARVGARSNPAKAVVSQSTAKALESKGLARVYGDGKWITTSLEGEEPKASAQPKTKAAAKAGKSGTQQIEETITKAVAKGKAAGTKAAKGKDDTPAKPKVNGRKAKADASPYSTAPVGGLVKRHGKSRRTGSMTRVVDLLHPKAPRKIEGAGRYMVECETHDAREFVPDMTAAKPLQARTDQFCKPCAKAVADREAAETAKADAKADKAKGSTTTKAKQDDAA